MEFIPKFLFNIIDASTEGDVDDKVLLELNSAITDGRFEFLINDGIVIGFYTWHDKKDGILINNMCILKQFRNRNNLLSLRKYMRSKLKDNKTFYWENRKKQKEVVWNF